MKKIVSILILVVFVVGVNAQAISTLPAFSDSLRRNDVLPIVHNTQHFTNRVTVNQLYNYILSGVPYPDTTTISTKAYVQNYVTNNSGVVYKDTVITAVNGGKFVCATGQTGVLFLNTGTIASDTLVLPPNVPDGFTFFIKGNGNSMVITTLWFKTSDGSSTTAINNLSQALYAGYSNLLKYHKATNTWY